MSATIDFEGRYRVAGWPGVAVWIDGWEQRWEPLMVLCCDPETGEEWDEPDPYGEGEYVDDPESGMVRVVMVGDDHRHLVDVSDLIPLDEDDYCHECGQIGCTHDGRDRS